MVGKDWHKVIPEIRSKINNAIKDMPEHEELVKLLSGAREYTYSHILLNSLIIPPSLPDINYFHCLRIIEILKQTEADTKNVFGRYGSQRMKDWQDVVKVYEKDNAYLGEAAQILLRNINYEIPGLKKQIAKFEQLSEESQKKSKDVVKSQNSIRSEYNAICSQLGIPGQNIRKELIERLNDLPKLLQDVASVTPGIKKAVTLYGDYAKSKEILPLLRHVMQSGNTTVYEFLYSEAPLSVEEPPLQISAVDEEKATAGGDNEIDFGDDNGGEIDFGDADVETVEGDIDWGDIQLDDVQGAADQQIDFEISLEESGIVVEGGGMSGGVARDEEAFTVLDAAKYRDQFIDELYELEAFLKMRLFELTAKTEFIAMLDEIVGQDLDTVQEMLGLVEVCLAKVTNAQLQYLHQVKHSASYIDILSAKVNQKLKAIEKLKGTEGELKEKSVKLQQEANDLRPNLAKMVAQTKGLQEKIESDVSKKYKNRVVNLMGGMNTI